jgi:hypothetical protein
MSRVPVASRRRRGAAAPQTRSLSCEHSSGQTLAQPAASHAL